MTAIYLLVLVATPPPEWGAIREAFRQEAPELAAAQLTVVDPHRLELRLPSAQPLAAGVYDDLLAATLSTLSGGPWSLSVVGPNGEDLSPTPLSDDQIASLAADWRANRPRPSVTWQAPPSAPGALHGVRIALSAGHGTEYSGGNWGYQRGLVLQLIEDLHNNEIVFRHLAPMLEAAGAEVILMRERSPYPERVVVDNDGNGTAGSYSETGEWLTGGYPGHGGTYRYATTAAQGGSRATWELPIVRPDDLPVYVWYVALDNRSPAARYEIDHAAGTSVVLVDERRDGARWRYLGTFPFAPGRPAAVHLDNTGDSAGSVIIADAVRLGGGAGFADMGGGVSGKQRWQQCAQVNAVEEEVPSTTTTGTNDVTVRPATALWQGVDLFVSMHTNAGGGSGTSTFVYSNAVAYPNFDPDRATPLQPGTLALQESIHSSLMQTFRANWDPAWQDRGMWGADFGELRPLTQAWRNDSTVAIPATLLELAFHDDPGDAVYLREDRFRADAARAIYRGILKYVHADQPAAAIPTPLAPGGLVARLGVHGIELSWAATTDALEPLAVADRYDVEVSADGWAFSWVGSTADTHLALNGLSTCDTSAFRVIAVNAGGFSVPSKPVVVRVNRDLPRVLWVDGDRRLNRTALERPEGPNTAARMLNDLSEARQGGLTVESARAEAVGAGTVNLGDWDLVVWSTGETSSIDSALTTNEQAAIATYLDGGGALLISGAEIGWDLVEKGSAADQAFYGSSLSATFVADSANTFQVSPAASALWLSGLAATGFDDGTGRSFRVEYPDVIAPLGGAVAELTYSTGGVAALRFEGAHRLFYAGFPIEAIEDQVDRGELMARLIDGLLGGTGTTPVCGEPYGEPTTDDGAPGDDGGDAGGDPVVPPPDVAGGCGCASGQSEGACLALGLIGTLLLRRRGGRRCSAGR